MPRKKVTEVISAPTATPEPIAEKPKRTSRAKKPSATEPTAVVEAIAEPATKSARGGTTKQKSTSTVTAKTATTKKTTAKSPAKKATASADPILEVDAEPAAGKKSAVSKSATSPKTTAPKTTSPKPKPVRKSLPKVEAEPVATLEPSSTEGSNTSPSLEKKPARPSRSKSRAKKPAVSETKVDETGASMEDVVFEAGPDDLPVPIWRPVSKSPATAKPRIREKAKPSQTEKAEEAPASSTTDETDDGGKRGRRRRRRGKRQEGTEVAEETPVAAKENAVDEDLSVEDAPAVSFRRKERKNIAPPPRPTISVPDQAPQVVLRNGVPTLVRDRRVYPPVMFFGGASDDRSTTTVLDELRMASEAGVHLHSYLVDFEVDESAVDANVQLAAYLLSKSVEIDKESQVLFRLVFKAPRGWQDRYPRARYLHEDGSLAEPSVCDDEFWTTAKKCLDAFVRKLRALSLSGHILGVHLDRGEWFIAEGWGYDTSEAAKIKFRDWARVRYLDDDVMLRASWFDGNVSFNDLTVPFYQPEGQDGDKFVRSSRKQRRYVDYHLFLSDATVQRIGELAYTAKEASEGWFLVGASYGYTFEWSHPGSGHLSLGKLLRTQEIDFVAGPPSYRTREPGGTAPFPGPIDSFALNGKLYISEEDFKTSLSGGREPDDFNPMIKTPQALESVHWRGAGAALAHGSGVSWMDLWGNGWLKTPSIWDRASKVSEGLLYRMGAGIGEPDVCVFIDERALAYLVDQNAFSLLVQNVRESVLRAGVNAGFYLLSDLAHREKFPEAKVYIFLNAWDIRPDTRAAIKSRLQRDGKVLFWLYSAGLFDAGRDSLERAREVTGIALKPQPFYSKSGTTILNRRHPLCEAFPDRSLVTGTKLEPSYFAIPEDALILGEYSQTGLPSFVVKEFTGEPEQRWTSIFLGEPQVNPSLVRAMAQMAGAHVWNFNEDLVHVRPPFLTVHCAGTGPRAIALPNKWVAYNLLTKQWVQTDSTNLRFTANDGTTHVFLVGSQEEVEQLLTLDHDDLLTMASLPPRQDNTLGTDANAFDIPIMKLNEWMEGGDADEVADEWFLRPHQIVEEPAKETGTEVERPGRRRRRNRRQSGDRKATQEEVKTTGEFSGSFEDDLGINVVFRKRD